jgi:signal transduction histidine kinase
MWRALEVFRPIAWLYAVYTAYVRQDDMARPWLAWLVLGALGAWTVSCLLYRARVRSAKWVSAELLLACAAILSTALVDTPSAITGGARTLPGLWPAAAVVAWAVLRGWRAGMFAALLVGAADLLELGAATLSSINSHIIINGATIVSATINGNTINNIVILVLLGGCIGFCADLAREGHAALREALRVQAEVGERDRLARTVHDGVLQILAYIHRRGLDLGGEAQELGSMAGDQERILRTLVSNTPSLPRMGGGDADVEARGEVDLRSVLGQFADGTASVIPPAEPVLISARVADELAAAVSAALDNVRRHAGADAQTWILIEDKAKEVTITIRDNGVGVPAGRLAEAAASGRMGMAKSIEGRLRDLGGTATLDSSPGTGTSLELNVPKEGIMR